jgi:hypothetical protein
MMAGAPVPAMALESRSRRPRADGERFNDWVAQAGPPSALWHWVATDGDGRFELGGLDERHYRLSVMPTNGLDIQTTDPIRAGADGVVLSLPEPDLYDKIAGVVQTPDGRPVHGATVKLWRPVYDSTARVFGGTSQVILTEDGGTTATDEAGWFSFEDVPREGAILSVRGDDIVPVKHDLADEKRPRQLELVVDVRCHLQVFVLDPAEGPYDAFAVADADGRPLEVLEILADSVNAYTDAPLAGGKSGVLSVSIRAERLILMRNGQALETVRIRLVPGEVNRVEI